MKESLQSLVAWIVSVLRLGNPELPRLRTQEIQFEQSIRDGHEDLGRLKTDIERLEEQAVQIKRTLDRTAGESRRVLIAQIEQAFEAVELLRDREELILGNLRRSEVALAKVRESIVSIEQGGPGVAALEDLEFELAQKNAEMAMADRATDKLRAERYRRPERLAPTLALSAIARKLDAAQLASSKLEARTGERAAPSLAPELEKRLRELVGEPGLSAP